MSEEYGADEYCRVCSKPIRLRANMFSGRSPRYICCNGRDCACGGGTFPNDVCSLACWESEGLEALEEDGPMDLEDQLERALDAAFPAAKGAERG